MDQFGRTPLNENIQIGVDHTGDPFVRLAIVTPEGVALSADMCDQLGLKLVAAAAMARARAQIVRKQLLNGIPAQDAVALVNSLMEP